MTMPMLTKSLGAGILAATLMAALASGDAKAGTLENLERERALYVVTFLDPDLTPVERHTRLAAAQPRLLDLERMVLRDDSLGGRNTPIVRKAFENYDLTFLVQGAYEGGLSPADSWLKQLGITTQSVMSAQVVRR